MRFAIVQAGVVVNVIESDADYAASIGAIASETASPGWLWDGTSFSAPPPAPPIVPQEVDAVAGMKVLILEGLLDTVLAVIAALPEPQQSLARVDFDRKPKWQRTNTLLLALAEAAGITSDQLDELFIAAGRL